MLPSYHKGGTVKEIDLQGLINEWTVLGTGGHIPFPCVKMGAEWTFQPASLTRVLASLVTYVWLFHLLLQEVDAVQTLCLILLHGPFSLCGESSGRISVDRLKSVDIPI